MATNLLTAIGKATTRAEETLGGGTHLGTTLRSILGTTMRGDGMTLGTIPGITAAGAMDGMILGIGGATDGDGVATTIRGGIGPCGTMGGTAAIMAATMEDMLTTAIPLVQAP